MVGKSGRTREGYLGTILLFGDEHPRCRLYPGGRLFRRPLPDPLASSLNQLADCSSLLRET